MQTAPAVTFTAGRELQVKQLHETTVTLMV